MFYTLVQKISFIAHCTITNSLNFICHAQSFKAMDSLDSDYTQELKTSEEESRKGNKEKIFFKNAKNKYTGTRTGENAGGNESGLFRT